jgi:hypothetical protein
MNTMLRYLIRGASLVTLVGLFSISWAQAEEAPGMRIGVRGEITEVGAERVKVHANSGENLTVNLTKDTKIRAVTLANIEDIKPGSYIGSAAIPQEDGSLKALEVHVFPPELAGSGDGHRPLIWPRAAA